MYLPLSHQLLTARFGYTLPHLRLAQSLIIRYFLMIRPDDDHHDRPPMHLIQSNPTQFLSSSQVQMSISPVHLVFPLREIPFVRCNDSLYHYGHCRILRSPN